MNRGQFSTKNRLLQEQVFELCHNDGRSMEPSAGVGYLCEYFKNRGKDTDVALEIDETLTFLYDVRVMNFFDYDPTEKFDTIYGNPPYVRQQFIEDKQKINSMYGESLNLYLYFMEKCFHHLNPDGELVFIIPRDLLTSTRASGIRELLYENGTITDVIDYEEQKVFEDASPYVIIIRYEKGNFTHKTNYTVGGETTIRDEIHQDSYIKFLPHTGSTLDEYFDVRVGIVSGKNSVFQDNILGNVEIICSDFIRTNQRKKYIFNKYGHYSILIMDYLYLHKQELITRRIREFGEENWYQWGAIRNIEYMEQGGKCIYVNNKTRADNPFFIEDIGYFDGSMIALFPKEGVDIYEWIDVLNDADRMREQGFLINNKYQFTQKMLSKFMV